LERRGGGKEDGKGRVDYGNGHRNWVEKRRRFRKNYPKGKWEKRKIDQTRGVNEEIVE